MSKEHEGDWSPMMTANLCGDEQGEGHKCAVMTAHHAGLPHKCVCGVTWPVEESLGKDPRHGMPAASGNPDLRLDGLSKHEALMVSGAVRRYHTHPYIVGHQTVGEHTFRAMALMISLWPAVTNRALVAMLVHDAAEGEVGDVPSPAKWAYGKLGAELDAAETAVMDRLGLNVKVTPEERDWIKTCDWLEGLYFCRDQFRLGNGAGTRVIAEAYASALLVRDLPAHVREVVMGLVQDLELTGERRLSRARWVPPARPIQATDDPAASF